MKELTPKELTADELLMIDELLKYDGVKTVTIVTSDEPDC